MSGSLLYDGSRGLNIGADFYKIIYLELFESRLRVIDGHKRSIDGIA